MGFTKRYLKIITVVFLVTTFSMSYLPISTVSADEYKNNYINFSNLDVSDGLSQSSANYIYQDSLGYMWIGTADGLNRYNGHNFKKYKVNISEEGAISSNYISAIVEDNEQNLWIGTANGLNKLDRKTDEFTVYNMENSNIAHYNITEVMFDKNNDLWISTVDGISKYDVENNIFTNILDGKENVISTNIYSIQIDNDGLMWIGSDAGLQVYDPKTDVFVDKYSEIISEIKNKFIYDLFYDSGTNALWIGTEGNGVYRADLTSKSVKRIGENEGVSDNIRHILKSKQNEIWIGTANGIVKYNEASGEITKYRQQKSTNQSLISNNVLSLCEDRSGLIWVGTMEGISKFNSSSIFKNYKYDENIENSLNEGMISGIYEDDDGYLWVNTFTKGINIINSKTGEVNKLNVNVKNLSEVEYWGIDGYKNIIYSATSEGLLVIDKDNKTTKMIDKSNNDNFPENNLRKIYVDSDGLVWIGSINGLCTLNQQGEITNYTEFLKEKGAKEVYISAIHQDKQDPNIMWIGSAVNGGLIKFNTKTNEVRLFNDSNSDPNKSLSVNSIKCIDEDEKGNLWIATNYGLNKFDKSTEEIEKFTEKEGLSNNFVYGALVDVNGDVWCSTNDGISMLDTNSNTIMTFTTDDGIACNEFNGLSYFKNKDGEMFFGGIDGLTTFNPIDFKPKKYTSRIIIDNIKIRGVHKSDYNSDIILNHKENTFEVEFFMNDYKNNNNKRYYYMLEGFDKEWIDNGNRNYISYTNVPAGEYRLHIGGKNSVGEAIENDVLKITITNAPWKTPAAYWCYAILIGLIIYIWINKVKLLEQMIRQRTHELNIKLTENQMLYDKVIQHERYKNNYFVNLSHELRTPLNVIASTEQLISKLNEAEENIEKEKLSEYMKGIKGNSNRLLNLINNIIDTSKIDSGAFKISKQDCDIVYIVEETTLSLASLAEQRNISLIIDPEVEEKIISCDKYNIERCITNLVGNALKFTPEGGDIIVKINDYVSYVTISVKDNGIGIDKKYHKAIFDRFGQAYSQGSEEYGGSGLGLTLTNQIVELHNGSIEVISEPNEGAEFIITLPV